ncbi:MAG TPA: hypothetical protein VK639_14170 [Terriglobales bacterium]|nr:hypothetical protein [Terriglobales bacterium]
MELPKPQRIQNLPFVDRAFDIHKDCQRKKLLGGVKIDTNQRRRTGFQYQLPSLSTWRPSVGFSVPDLDPS